MATTGTMSSYGSTFGFPSGTLVVPAQVLSFPELMMGERNTTNHGSGGFEERRPNGLTAAGDFTLTILSTPNQLETLYTDMKAKTERVSHLKNPSNQYVFTAWIRSIKEDDADATSPDSVKAVVTVTPVGEITMANS